MDAEDVNKIDWSKIVMGIAVAIVFIMQQYHAMKLEDVKNLVVPRPEFEQRADRVMDKDEILQALEDINNRMLALEKK